MANPDDNVQSVVFLDITDDDSVVATHPEQIEFPNRVAPNQAGQDKHNTIKPFLIVVGCSLTPDNHFQFESSFVSPGARSSMRRLGKLFDGLTDQTIQSEKESDKTPPLSIFGHADPTGSPEYNSILSARRSKAVFGLLIRDADIWEHLFSDRHPMGGDNWGDAALQTMIEEVGFPPGEPVPATDADMQSAIKKAQQDKKARRALILAYMDAICVKVVNGKDEKFQMTKENFLARGADKQNGKGDLQGCGEFNPVFLQSQDDIDKFEKTPASSPDKPVLKEERDAANAKDRRVLVFLFKPGTRIDHNKWPCPHVNQGAGMVEVCKRRFWSDGKERIKPAQSEEREFKKTQNTFGCRFYHGIAQNSPCDGVNKQWAIRLLEDVPREDKNPPKEPTPLAKKKFLALLGEVEEAPRIRGQTDENGVLRLPVLDEEITITLRIESTVEQGKKDKPPDQNSDAEEEDNFLALKLQAGSLQVKSENLKLDDGEALSDEKKTGVKQRLHNLGYGRDKIEEWDEREFSNAVKAFKRHHKLGPSGRETGDVDNAMLQKLRQVYDTPPQKKTEQKT